ncbi:MAG: HAMP domain-containing protein [Desulfovibrionaceae bacterium]|nr:HAMP domain-containing protein [Desulfovibrionaceae bacterium]MBF0513841.1 HAMP domain-containing protein [Desulfovibrionaceae bacterium]
MRPSKLFKTISFRLAALYAVLFAVSASLLFGVIYWIASQALLRQLQDGLMRETSSLADDLQSGGMSELVRSIQERLAALDLPPAYALLLDASGRKLAGNLEKTFLFEGFTTLPAPVTVDRGHGGVEDVDHAIYAFARGLPDGSYLLVGEDGNRIDEAKQAILLAFGWGMATTLLLAVGGGVLLSSGFLRRIEVINRTTRAIVAGNLDDRVPSRATGDEFDQLAANFNAMLDRIQILMESLRQVSSDIAHDLRSPLHRLRQRLEGGRAHAKTVAECHEALDSALSDTDNILSIFAAILGIAQIESGNRRCFFVDVDLSAVIANIAEAYGAVAEDRGQILSASITQGLTVRGDRALLTQMLVNLVENSIRHCPEQAHIALKLERDQNAVVVSVSDTGPGIPKEEWTNIFKRFYRIDRSRSTAGSGLGLALVKAVVDLHGAIIELSDEMPGLRVRLRFPDAFKADCSSQPLK